MAAVGENKEEGQKICLSASNTLADYESETRNLEAVAKQDGIFQDNKPMVFEPGDPRIAKAVAEIKSDPLEVFKPRPESELNFLDAIEVELEQLKRFVCIALENSIRHFSSFSAHLVMK